MLLIKIPIKRPSYRERIVIQKRPRQKNRKITETPAERKQRYQKLINFLYRCISMYKKIMNTFEPFSEEQKICIDSINNFINELEIVQNGTDEEREEVYEKYGKYIN